MLNEPVNSFEREYFLVFGTQCDKRNQSFDNQSTKHKQIKTYPNEMKHISITEIRQISSNELSFECNACQILVANRGWLLLNGGGGSLVFA